MQMQKTLSGRKEVAEYLRNRKVTAEVAFLITHVKEFEKQTAFYIYDPDSSLPVKLGLKTEEWHFDWYPQEFFTCE